MMGQREPFALISLKAEGTVSKSPARSASIAPLQWRLAISPTRTPIAVCILRKHQSFHAVEQHDLGRAIAGQIDEKAFARPARHDETARQPPGLLEVVPI